MAYPSFENLKLKEGRTGMEGPLRAPIPLQTELQPRREAEQCIQCKRGQKWQPVVAEAFLEKLM